MQSLLEHAGVTVAAITGVLAARGKTIDLFGVIVLALVTALGGGTLRDLVLGDTPIFWVRDQRYLLNAGLSAVVLFYVVRYREVPMTILLVADAFVLAFYTILGTRKGLAFDTAASVAVAMGVITGVAGGILRDLLIGELPLVFRQETYLYATAAFFGALLFVGLEPYPVLGQSRLVIGVAATLLLRLAGIRWRIALPMFRSTSERKSGSRRAPG
jgi:uncharacterized membrane protein YeiH